MSKTSKTSAVFLTLIIAMSCVGLLVVKPTNAQSTKIPVPELSAKFIDGSYDVPANTSIDPFTGQTIIIPAQHINNQTIIATIKDRTNLYEGNNYGESRLYYQIQMKGHYSQEWVNISHVEAYPPSEYTVVTYAVDGNNAAGQFDSHLNQISSSDTVDFRVQAQIWSLTGNPYQMPIFWMTSESDWSETQTVTTSALSVNTLVLIISAIALIAVAISVLLYARCRNLKETLKEQS